MTARLLSVLVLAAACAGPATREQAVVYTSVDQVFSDPLFRACGQRLGVDVRAVFDTEETKSTGILNRLIAEAPHPQADVFWSGDPVRPFLLVSRGLVEPYRSPAAAAVPSTFRAGDGTWTGIAARARVLLVNTELVPEDERPASLLDLADPRWRAQAAIANPLYGTTTMHVAALAVAWGEERTRAFLDELRANEVRVASSNGEVRRLVAAGEVAVGLTDSDDAHVALAEGRPVAVVYPDQEGLGTLIMPTTVVLLAGAPHPEAGRRLVDCLLSAETEEHLARQAAHMPLRSGAAPVPGVDSVAGIRAMTVDYRQIADMMETMQPWLREWVGL